MHVNITTSDSEDFSKAPRLRREQVQLRATTHPEGHTADALLPKGASPGEPRGSNTRKTLIIKSSLEPSGGFGKDPEKSSDAIHSNQIQERHLLPLPHVWIMWHSCTQSSREGWPSSSHRPGTTRSRSTAGGEWGLQGEHLHLLFSK